jgi:formate hydrogenlyase transcriptional activator
MRSRSFGCVSTTLREFERSLILQTQEEVGWVIGGRKGAAAKLGLKRTTLIHRMQKPGICRPSLPPLRL